MVLDIPYCPAQSRTIYRIGKPSCTSDWYPTMDADGNLVLKTSPCNIGSLAYYCFNTYRFCWEWDHTTGNKILIRTETSTGIPSTSVCPPLFTPPDIFPTGCQVNCNRVCGDWSEY